MDKRRSSVNAEQAILLVAVEENWALVHILKICGVKKNSEITISIKEHPEEFSLRKQKSLNSVSRLFDIYVDQNYSSPYGTYKKDTYWSTNVLCLLWKVSLKDITTFLQWI